MWIVQLALRRPYTFIVAALLLVLSIPWVLSRMAVDVFPDVDIPAVGILLSYNGLSAEEMDARVTRRVEGNLTSSVSDIERVESQSVAGMAPRAVPERPSRLSKMPRSRSRGTIFSMRPFGSQTM